MRTRRALVKICRPNSFKSLRRKETLSSTHLSEPGPLPWCRSCQDRNAIGIDIDPIACRISRILTSRFDAPHLVDATHDLQQRLRGFESLLVSEPEVYQGLGPGGTFELGSQVFRVPSEPAIAYWFDPSHMATLSIVREVVACEENPLVRQAFEVAISSSIIRKWPNTLSYAMDIDHTRPHRPENPEGTTNRSSIRTLPSSPAPGNGYNRRHPRDSRLLSTRRRRYLKVTR